MSQEIGYARVSKMEQHLALQLDALKKRGVVRVFTDKQTGIRFDRKAFLAAIAYLNEGDTLVVWKLDRLGRSLQQLIETLEKLKKRNIHLVSLIEDVNTSTPTGMLFFQLIAMLAEFEHNIISERTKAGLDAARARGRTGGSIIDLFIKPWLSHGAPSLLQTAPPLALVLFFLGGSVLSVLGTLLLGITTLRARVYPRGAAILLLVATIANVLTPFFTQFKPYFGSTTLILVSLSFAWFGSALYSQTTGEERQGSLAVSKAQS